MKVRLSFALLAVALLAGCSTLSFEQRLAAGYQIGTGLQSTTAAALDARRIPSTQAENVLEIADRTKIVLDTAAQSRDEGALNMALKIMRNLENYVE